MSLRNERWLAWLFFLTGVALLAWAAFVHFAPPPGPALEVAETDIEVADFVLGDKREVVLRLHNTTGQPMRVLGLTLC
jgi:hypothetical protein